MVDRWQLNRAGILNVYQYGDDEFEFAGGRLLLRGVNGSGKSTAMNMLLPFLLEADVRRIDAAGEQSGVLRSWMLSGRDEQQPVGYLWIEFRRGDDYLVCGCGLRANQSTEKVRTWWFVTPMRPGIDVKLVDGRVPLSVDALRAALGPTAVYADDQRTAYRERVRAELFGGADLTQHLRLLHVVRSPRVGDRIDNELTAYLDDALPQLSDTAIDDAAQPLENLEEHRRTVAALTATAETLDALTDVYRSYATGDARRRADHAKTLVTAARAAERAQRSAATAATAAETALDAARDEVARLEGHERRLGAELDALRDQPAFREGRKLEQLRDRVRSLRDRLATAELHVTNRQRDTDDARAGVESARRAATEASDDLSSVLVNVGTLAQGAGVAATAVVAPACATELINDVDVPAGPLVTEPCEQAVGAVRTAATARRGDVEEVRRLHRLVERAEAALTVAEDRLSAATAGFDEATAQVDRAAEALAAARTELAAAVSAWAAEAARIPEPDDDSEAAAGLRALSATSPVQLDDATARVSRFADRLRDERAALDARSAIEAATVESLRTEVERLAALPEPDVPRWQWQRDGSVALAQVVDFADDVDEASRLGYEAALEASGLLGARIAADGIVLADGELVGVASSADVGSPLSAVLDIVVPEALSSEIDVDVIGRFLQSVSTDHTSTAETVVASDGSFRTGVLRGRHRRDHLEHVGAAARHAALQRLREQVATELRAAEAQHDRTIAAVERVVILLDSVTSHLRAAPSTRPLDLATLALAQAETTVEQRRAELAERQSERDRREQAAGEAAATVRRSAATFALPHDPQLLDDIDGRLVELVNLTSRVPPAIKALVRSHSAWSSAADRHGQAVRAVADATATADSLRAEHEPLATELATAEDALGATYDEIVSVIDASTDELAAVRKQLPEARQSTEDHVHVLADAKAQLATETRATADAASVAVAALPRLRAALDQTGYRAALTASHEPDTDANPVFHLPVVTDSVEGLAQIAGAILDSVAPPDRPANAESVRQSLRQRRDRLGANWDAADHQPDDTLPLEIEVTGPYGRMPLVQATGEVRAQLSKNASLLTAQQDQALRNLLQGVIAQEVSRKLHAARELVDGMNKRLGTVSTAHGISARLRWTRSTTVDESLLPVVELMSKLPELRTAEEDATLSAALSARLDEARRAEPDAPYRDLIASVFDYRRWHDMNVLIERPGRSPERLSRKTALSEGEKKVVSYLPLFAAVAASCDALAEIAPSAPRFVLLDDAFAKVSEDNHPKLFGLLVELELDFIATSERLWGTYSTVPELAITEVVRDAGSGVILLEHARWDGTQRVPAP